MNEASEAGSVPFTIRQSWGPMLVTTIAWSARFSL